MTIRTDTDDVDVDAEIRVDPGGVILAVSDGVEAILGRPADSFIGRSAMAWIHRDDLTIATTIVAAMLGAKTGTIPFRCRLGDDADGWTPVGCTVSCDEPGRTLSIRIRPSRAFPDGGTDAIDVAPPIEMNPLHDFFEEPGVDGFFIATATAPVFATHGVGRVFGMTSDEFFSSFGDLLHPDDSDRMVDLLSRLAAGNERYVESTVRALRVDGDWGVFRIRTRDLSRDPDFAVYITAMHELREDDVAESEGEVDPRLRRALNLASDPILVIADDGRVRFASSSSMTLLRRPTADITTHPFTDLLTPDSLDAFAEWWRDPEAVSCRVRFVVPSSTPRWVVVRTVDSGTAPDRTATGWFRVVALRDIDDLVRAEEALGQREARFAALMQNASSGVVVLGDNDVVIAPGHALEQVLGLASEEASGLDLVESVHPDDRSSLRDELANARDHEGPSSITVRQRNTDGAWRWIHWTAEDFRSDPAIKGLVVNLDDRTDEVQARIDLESSERRLRAIVDHSFEVTVIADTDFMIMWASPSLTDLLGWDATAVTGRAILDFVHPDDVDLALVRYDRARTDDGPEPSTPIRVRTEQGTWRHVMVVASDRRDDPDVGGLILNLRDAERQVADERALTESENRYRVLVENSTDVVAILAPDATVTWVSPTIQQVIGIAPDQVIGHALGDTNDAATRADLVRAFRSVLGEPGRRTRTIAPIRDTNGTTRWMDLVLTNRLDEPGIAGVVAAYRDITERIEADHSRRASEERFRSLAESSPLGIFQLDASRRCTYVNDRWCEITGQRPDDAMGPGWRDPFRRGGTELADDLAVGDGRTTVDAGLRIVRPDGSVRWCSLHIAPLADAEGNPTGSVGTIDDITTSVLARHETKRLSSILESSPDLVLVFATTGAIVYLNEAARRFFLIGPDDPVTGLSAADLFGADEFGYWTTAIGPTLRRREAWQGEVTITNRAGHSIPISAVVNVHRDVSGQTEVVSVTGRDMTERAELEARLEHQATHDPLTGLPNRSLLLDRLGVALARASRQGTLAAVLFADLDRFKVVNDGLGHATGDVLLQTIARRLSATVRPGDTVARLGGDEFVIVCEDLDNVIEAQVVAERIAAAVAEPVTIGTSEIVGSVSIGITVVNDTDEDPDQVIRDADAAMYLAKQHGRARWEIFDPDLRVRASNRLTIENALRHALQHDEFRLFYQPIIDLQSGHTVGAEALLRWDHPDHGLLAPGAFLDVAEDSGLIVPIGDWVLATACTQMHEVITRRPDFSISVNLSARQIDDAGLIDRIESIVESRDTPPGRVILEITESALMGDVGQSGATLAQLKHLGFGLAIDDFGTGYSSLAYLQRYPVDVLKIDRSFVAGLGRTAGDEAIVEAVIGLARALGLRAVAEGVETDGQIDILRRLDCHSIQGYRKSKPLAVEAFHDFVASASS